MEPGTLAPALSEAADQLDAVHDRVLKLLLGHNGPLTYDEWRALERWEAEAEEVLRSVRAMVWKQVTTPQVRTGGGADVAAG